MTNAVLNHGSFFKSLRTQLRVIYALLMREIITRYGRHNIGFMWMFVEPMMFTIGVAALWSFSGVSHSGMPVISFAITGYSAVLLWRNMPSRCSGAIQPNLSLMYHRNVKVLDVFLARLLLEGAGATMSFIILSVVFISINWMPPPEDILKIAIGWSMLAWFGCALAITIGALSELSEIVEKLWHPFTYLMFPLSGAVFMVDWLPASVQPYILYLPMVHGVEILREGYYGSLVKAHYDIGYMATFCMCLTLLGLILTQRVSRKVTPE
jgi:ABC-2 type transport system permease protein/capsular polysaccharide transport system permease protein